MNRSTPSVEDYLGRSNNRVIRVGSYIYVDGGEVAQTVDGAFDTYQPSYPVNETISIDLMKSWTNTTLSMTVIPKSAPPTDGSAIWSWSSPSGTGFYIWGGESAYWEPAPEFPLWRFTSNDDKGEGPYGIEPGSGTWENEPVFYSGIVRVANAASAQSDDTVFILGGSTGPSIDPNAPENDAEPYYTQSVPGMLSYNMTTDTWRNISTETFTPTGTFTDGNLHFIRGLGTNKEGILVPLGGLYPSLIPGNSARVYLSLNNISVFDIATNTWHWQTATGTIPKPRGRACSVAVKENGTESWELFMFGGYYDYDNSTMGDMHVLSLPSFTWSKADVEVPPRTGHNCVVGENSRLMVSVGAGGPGGGAHGWQYRDPWPQGVGVFDLTAMEWTAEYNPDAQPYERPEFVNWWYEEGGPNQTTVNWSSDGVRRLFTTYGQPDKPEEPAPTDKTKSSPATATIVGGTVGGVVALLIAALIIYYTRRRRRMQKGASLNGAQELESNKQELEPDADPSNDDTHELPISREKHELPTTEINVYELPTTVPASELPVRRTDDVSIAETGERSPKSRQNESEGDEEAVSPVVVSPNAGGSSTVSTPGTERRVWGVDGDMEYRW